MRATRPWGAAAAVACLTACAATSNPEPGQVRPVGAAPKPAPVAPARVNEPAVEPVPTAGAQEATSDTEPQAPRLVIGSVGGEPIEAQALLERLWMRDSRSVLDQFEFLVFSRIALFEADRLGVRVSPTQVDLVVQRTIAAVTARLEKTAPGLSLDQFVGRVLELDRPTYDRKVRTDAVLQLLTERCVRAWFLETPRRELDLIEFADDAQLAAGEAALAAGTPFEEVARLHGLPEDADAGGLHMTLARNEESDLARLAFATPLGEVGGPIQRDGHYLLVRPVRDAQVVEGRWDEVAPRVEQSLADEPLDSQPTTKEYEQWRTAMSRRYPLDLKPFLELVRSASP